MATGRVRRRKEKEKGSGSGSGVGVGGHRDGNTKCLNQNKTPTNKKGVAVVECVGSVRNLLALRRPGVVAVSVADVDGSVFMSPSVPSPSSASSPSPRHSPALSLSRLQPSLQRLTITRCGLSAVPPCVLDLSRLRSLSLARNRLTALPKGFDRALPELTALNLDDNRFVALDPAVCRLAKLTRLSIRNNLLSGFGDDIGELSRLVELEADHNDIGPTLPDAFAKLKHLRVLGLSHNRLTKLPKFMCTPETCLTVLRLGNNLIPPIRPASGGGTGPVSVLRTAELPAFVRVAAKEEETAVRGFLRARARSGAGAGRR